MDIFRYLTKKSNYGFCNGQNFGISIDRNSWWWNFDEKCSIKIFSFTSHETYFISNKKSSR